MKNIGTKIAKGAIWMVLFKLIERSVGLISTLILVRLLIPEDFGLLAMALSITTALELLGAFGFDMALIQNQKAGRDHYVITIIRPGHLMSSLLSAVRPYWWRLPFLPQFSITNPVLKQSSIFLPWDPSLKDLKT